jgi:Uma2 family endonuclease
MQNLAENIELPTFELVYDDGEPLETNWHRIQMNLLIELVHQEMARRGITDYFAGGNMFVYYTLEQARVVAAQPTSYPIRYRGPDFIYISGVDGAASRNCWVVWEEGGRYPDVIIELLSPSTANIDKTEKKSIYERVFRTPDYFWYDPASNELKGWRLAGSRYEPIEPDDKGRVYSRELDLWLGFWQSEHMRERALWLRFYDSDGRLVPTAAEAEHERAQTERRRADAERQRAEAAEAEVALLRARLLDSA